MNRSAQDLHETLTFLKRNVRQCLWVSALNLVLLMLITARVYELI